MKMSKTGGSTQRCFVNLFRFMQAVIKNSSIETKQSYSELQTKCDLFIALCDNMKKENYEKLLKSYDLESFSKRIEEKNVVIFDEMFTREQLDKCRKIGITEKDFAKIKLLFEDSSISSRNRNLLWGFMNDIIQSTP